MSSRAFAHRNLAGVWDVLRHNLWLVARLVTDLHRIAEMI